MNEWTGMPSRELRRIAAEASSRGDFGLAERALREELTRAPRDIEVHLGLVNALKAQGLRADRVTAARRAAGVAPRDPRCQVALGGALGATGQYEAALRAYEMARTLAPDDPAILTALGDTLERMRRREEARAACQRAIAVAPAFGPAYNLLGQLDALAGNDADAERWLDRAIRTSAQPDVRSTAWHRLGAIRERQERWDDAFACHTSGNLQLLETPLGARMRAAPVFAQLPHQYNPGSEAMIARWGARRFTDGLPDPVFLVGFPRSGTTLTEQVLGALPGTVTSDEEPVLGPVMRLALAMCNDPTPQGLCAALDGLTDAQVSELRGAYWKAVAQMVSPEARRAGMFVDKAPLRFIHLAYVNLLFPRAPVVFLVRDPRDCCLSCYFQDFALNPVLARFLALDTTADAYAAVMAFWVRARTRVSNPVLEVRYEDLVSDFEPQARRVVEFVGGAWSDEILRFQDRAGARAIRTPSYHAVTQAVSTRSVGKWTHYAAHLAPVAERLRPFVELLGYAP